MPGAPTAKVTRSRTPGGYVSGETLTAVPAYPQKFTLEAYVLAGSIAPCVAVLVVTVGVRGCMYVAAGIVAAYVALLVVTMGAIAPGRAASGLDRRTLARAAVAGSFATCIGSAVAIGPAGGVALSLLGANLAFVFAVVEVTGFA